MSDYRPRPNDNRGGEHRPGGREPGQWNSFKPPSQQELKAIIEDGDAKRLVESAKEVGEALAGMELATSQIRNIFASVRQIQMKWPPNADKKAEANDEIRQLLLLKPKLAYQAKRDSDKGGRGVEGLKQVLVPAIDLVTNREQFTRLAEYFEAILAYHKAAGGKD